MCFFNNSNIKEKLRREFPQRGLKSVCAKPQRAFQRKEKRCLNKQQREISVLYLNGQFRTLRAAN